MKRFKFMLFIVLIIGFLCINTHAADLIGTDGAANDSGIYAIQHTDDRVATIATDAGIRYSYEAATTSDTLTLAETGKILTVDCATVCEFELPEATVGMSFTFISIGDSSVFSVDPDGADTIIWDVSDIPLAAGEKVSSPGNTADSIELFSAAANVWAVRNINGAFTNGGS